MTIETIGRFELIRKIAINNVSNEQASEVLEKTLEEIRKALVAENKVKISSFGTFSICHLQK